MISSNHDNESGAGGDAGQAEDLISRAPEGVSNGQDEAVTGMDSPVMDEATHADILADSVRRAEAIIFAAGAPLSAAEIADALAVSADVGEVLMHLKALYAGRGVGLVEVDGRWRFQTAEDLSFLFVEQRHEQKKLSQAALETLAIIAYAQPVTRAEIEAVRGVAVSSSIVDTLMATGWVRYLGRRRTPGRPLTLGTTAKFLEHFGLEGLETLPGRGEMDAEGLLSGVIPDPILRSEATDEDTGSDDALGDDGHGKQELFVTDFMADSGETDD